jgi:hypothetical protein
MTKDILTTEFDLHMPANGVQIASDLIIFLHLKNITRQEDFFRLSDARLSIIIKNFCIYTPEYEDMEHKLKRMVFGAKKKFEHSIGNDSYSIGRAAIIDLRLEEKSKIKLGPKTKLKLEKRDLGDKTEIRIIKI